MKKKSKKQVVEINEAVPRPMIATTKSTSEMPVILENRKSQTKHCKEIPKNV